MITVVWSPGFSRSCKRTLRRRPDLREKIENALRLLSKDPFHTTLHTHKLKGDMAGSLACTVDFEYRIVFEFVPNPKTGEEEILLEAIGTHEEVY